MYWALLSGIASNLNNKICRAFGMAAAFCWPQYEFINSPVVRGARYEESCTMKLKVYKTTLPECISQFGPPQVATIDKNGTITLVYACCIKPQLLSKVDKSQPQNSNTILVFRLDDDIRCNLGNIQRIKEVFLSSRLPLKPQSADLISSLPEQKLSPEDFDGLTREQPSLLDSEELALEDSKSEEINRFRQKIRLFANVQGQNIDLPIDFINLRHLAQQPLSIKQRYILTAKKVIKKGNKTRDAK